MTRAPAGYQRFLLSGADVVALGSCADAVRRAVGNRTLYHYAATHPKRRALGGRGIAYAVTLPDGETRIVVRHSQHGGMLAPVTGDRFLPPTRAPRELDTALRLAAASVPTPEIIAYATYPAGAVFRRSDVATREIVGGRDLAEVLAPTSAPERRTAALAATRSLLTALQQAGARHPDLNVRNVLIVEHESGECTALVLDVDRVVFDEPGDPRIAATNVRRLVRSARKLRSTGVIAVTDDELAQLALAEEAVT